MCSHEIQGKIDRIDTCIKLYDIVTVGLHNFREQESLGDEIKEHERCRATQNC